MIKMVKKEFIINGKKYPKDTVDAFFRIYCIGCEVCKEKEMCYKIIKGEK